MGDYFQLSLFIVRKHNAKSAQTQSFGGRAKMGVGHLARKLMLPHCPSARFLGVGRLARQMPRLRFGP